MRKKQNSSWLNSVARLSKRVNNKSIRLLLSYNKRHNWDAKIILKLRQILMTNKLAEAEAAPKKTEVKELFAIIEYTRRRLLLKWLRVSMMMRISQIQYNQREKRLPTFRLSKAIKECRELLPNLQIPQDQRRRKPITKEGKFKQVTSTIWTMQSP